MSIVDSRIGDLHPPGFCMRSEMRKPPRAGFSPLSNILVRVRDERGSRGQAFNEP